MCNSASGTLTTSVSRARAGTRTRRARATAAVARRARIRSRRARVRSRTRATATGTAARAATGTATGTRRVGPRTLRCSLRRSLEPLSHVVRERAQRNRGEKIDAKSRVPRFILGHDALEVLAHLGILHFRVQLLETERFGELLEENFDENPRTRRRRFLCQLNVSQASPRHRIRRQEMGEKLSHIAQLIRLESVNRTILLHEDFVEKLGVHLVYKAKALREQAVVAKVRSLLGATFDEHRAQLDFSARGDVHLHQLVTGFFKVERRHDGEVNGTTKVDQVGLRHVGDFHLASSLRRSGDRASTGAAAGRRPRTRTVAIAVAVAVT